MYVNIPVPWVLIGNGIPLLMTRFYMLRITWIPKGTKPLAWASFIQKKRKEMRILNKANIMMNNCIISKKSNSSYIMNSGSLVTNQHVVPPGRGLPIHGYRVYVDGSLAYDGSSDSVTRESLGWVVVIPMTDPWEWYNICTCTFTDKNDHSCNR